MDRRPADAHCACSHTSSVLNGKIYAIGGWNNTALGTLEIFDPATNSWSTGPSMPSPRWDLTSSVLNGRIFAIGGCDAPDSVLGIVEIFDPATNSWSTGPSMPTALAALTSSVFNGKIYAI